MDKDGAVVSQEVRKSLEWILFQADNIMRYTHAQEPDLGMINRMASDIGINAQMSINKILPPVENT